MDKALIKFPSIEAFKNTIRNVSHQAEFQGFDADNNPIMDRNALKPVLEFTGTVKLHGTNAGVCSGNGEIWAQSKGNIITVEKDNQGFAFFVESNKGLLNQLIKTVREEYGVKSEEHVAVYGEWCGRGIQKGVAINELDKMFVIFKIKIRTSDEEENRWIDYDYTKLITPRLLEQRIYFIQQFPTFKLNIDFNKPQESQNQLVELTLGVEKECPVGKALGVSGVGEGIVWTGSYKGTSHVFKVKGEKHSASKVKTLANVDPEKLKGVSEFVDYAVTENRLVQAVEEVFVVPGVEITKKGLGNLIKWMMKDLVKEEMDALKASNLEPKDVAKPVSTKVVKWFVDKYPDA